MSSPSAGLRRYRVKISIAIGTRSLVASSISPMSTVGRLPSRRMVSNSSTLAAEDPSTPPSSAQLNRTLSGRS
jgi:serine acetyltransferase